MSPQPTNPAERRTSERRKRDGGPGNRSSPGNKYEMRLRDDDAADRRSPGGAGLDCAVVGEGGGAAAGLVERLASRYCWTRDHERWLGVVRDARFFLRAIADEIEAMDGLDYDFPYSGSVRAGEVVAARLRTEAER